MSSRSIGNEAEALSRKFDEERGYHTHKQPVTRFGFKGAKDLLSRPDRIGFDYVAVKPNELTLWVQVKHINKVDKQVLKDMITWQSDFTYDFVPSSIVYLDVWRWNENSPTKEMLTERWDLPRMMSELANREYRASLALERKQAKEEEVVSEMVEEIIPPEGATAEALITREPEANLEGIRKSAEESKATAEKNMPRLKLVYDKSKVIPLPELTEEDLKELNTPPEGKVETFFMGFTPKDDKEKVKKDIQEGVDVMLIKGEEKEGS